MTSSDFHKLDQLIMLIGYTKLTLNLHLRNETHDDAHNHLQYVYTCKQLQYGIGY